MKLRIHGNSLRLRLSQSEVGRLRPGSWIEESITFNLEERLWYCLEVATGVKDVCARFEDNRIRVIIPADVAATFAGTDQVSISSQRQGDFSSALEILIEKDFKCLHGSEPQDDDAFPNPRA